MLLLLLLYIYYNKKNKYQDIKVSRVCTIEKMRMTKIRSMSLKCRKENYYGF